MLPRQVLLDCWDPSLHRPGVQRRRCLPRQVLLAVLGPFPPPAQRPTPQTSASAGYMAYLPALTESQNAAASASAGYMAYLPAHTESQNTVPAGAPGGAGTLPSTGPASNAAGASTSAGFMGFSPGFLTGARVPKATGASTSAGFMGFSPGFLTGAKVPKATGASGGAGAAGGGADSGAGLWSMNNSPTASIGAAGGDGAGGFELNPWTIPPSPRWGEAQSPAQEALAVVSASLAASFRPHSAPKPPDRRAFRRALLICGMKRRWLTSRIRMGNGLGSRQHMRAKIPTLYVEGTDNMS